MRISFTPSFRNSRLAFCSLGSTQTLLVRLAIVTPAVTSLMFGMPGYDSLRVEDKRLAKMG